MKKVLLIGNGFNRCESEEYSSENVLKSVFPDSNFNIKTESFPLLFESLLGETINKTNSNDAKSIIEGRLKEVKKYIKGIKKYSKEIYKHIDLNDTQAILTTNYDFNIEFALFGKTNVKTTAVKKRNIGYVYRDGKMEIYHIHGDINDNHKICLGNVAYSKHEKAIFSNISLYRIDSRNCKDVLNDIETKFPKWVQLFFFSDIHIIGLELSSDEKDIWSILTFRSVIKMYYPDLIKNNIYYYEANKQSQERKAFFRGLSIIYEISNCDYKKAYVYFLDKIYKKE